MKKQLQQRTYDGKLYVLTEDMAKAFDAIKMGEISHYQLAPIVRSGRPDTYTRALRKKGLPLRWENRTFEGRTFKAFYFAPEGVNKEGGAK